LLKWTNYIFGWQRRYFILYNGVLHYCKEKGSPQRGMIHLEISQIRKHPYKPCRFFIDTGCTQIHLKAYTPGEALDWISALKANQTDVKRRTFTDEPRLSIQTVESSSNQIIHGKIGEMWSIHAQMQATIDLIPKNVIKTTPGIEKLVSLSEEMKMLATEVLQYMEIDEDFNRKTWSPVKSQGMADTFDFGKDAQIDNSVELVKKDKKKVMAGFPVEEENYNFEDAQSHISDEKLEEFKQIEVIMPIEAPITSSIMVHRDRLPHLRDPNEKINIWKVVKESIGQELSKITVPVYFNEPLSFIQRWAEDLTYNEILLRAADHPDPRYRLALVSSFAITSYTTSEWRTMKPFNPLLGETFELEQDGFRLLLEQVSHHPPISALHCEHEKYIFWASVQVRTTFKATHLLVEPQAKYHLILKPHNDHFLWNKPQTRVHNIIFGKIWVEHNGVVDVKNLENGDFAKVNWKRTGWFSKKATEVSGSVYDCYGSEHYKLEGTWNKGVDIVNNQTGEVSEAWRVYPFPKDFDWCYFFSDFTLQLNQVPELVPGIALTDSRYRPDQRALENGDLKLANSEKHRLEEKQRAARKKLEENHDMYFPRWFSLENEDEWRYTGGYWECKAQGHYPNIPDIF